MRNINEVFEDEEFELLTGIKEKHHYKSWRKFIIDAANALRSAEEKQKKEKT